jgi:hypothetical protein
MIAAPALAQAAVAAAMVWSTRVALRPDELGFNQQAFDHLEITGQAVAVAAIASVALWVAAATRRSTALVALCGVVGAVIAVGLTRRPVLPSAATTVVGLAWLGGAAAVLVLLAGISGAGRRSVRAAVLAPAALLATAALAVWADDGRGLGATLGPLRAPTTVATRWLLALHAATLLLTAAVVLRSRQPTRRRDTGERATRDGVLVAGGLWALAATVERAVHVLPVDSYRDGYVGSYRPWAMLLAVNLPLLATGALLVTVGWMLGVRPHTERLTSGRLVVRRRDPVAMLQADLAAWLGDPSLTIAYAGTTGPEAMNRSGGRYDRATTAILRDGEPLALMCHDVALTRAPDALATAAALAGVAMDANRYVALSEARLAEARHLGERLLDADATTRAEVQAALEAGPIALLRHAADAVMLGAPLDGVVADLRRATSEVRVLSHGLYPPELIDGGLAAALPDRAGAPTRRLPAAVEVTAFLAAADDPRSSFENRGTMLRVNRTVALTDRAVLDRIGVLGGRVDGTAVELPVGAD